MTTTSGSRIESYEQACAEHEWNVPERYNIAADVCDKHPRDKPAMVWERFDGETRASRLGRAPGPRQPGRARAARARGREGRPGRRRPPSHSRDRGRSSSAAWKLGAILLSMSVLYGDEGIGHRLRDSKPKVLVTDAANAPRFDSSLVDELVVLDDGLLDGQPTDQICEDTSADDPAQLYYTSGTTGMAKGIVHAHRYILAHEEFVYCHDVGDGDRFHGMGEWAWAAGHLPPARTVAPGRRPVRLPARGRLRPRQAARLPLPPRGHERLHDPDRDAGDDGDRERRRALPAEVPHRLLGGRAAQPGGDPLVSRPVRRHRARLLRAHRVLPAVRELPLHGGPRGLDGPGDAGLGRRRSSTRTRTRWSRASAARSACAPAPTRTTRSATGDLPEGERGDLRRRVVSLQGRGDAWTRTATSGTPAAPTT